MRPNVRSAVAGLSDGGRAVVGAVAIALAVTACGAAAASPPPAVPSAASAVVSAPSASASTPADSPAGSSAEVPASSPADTPSDSPSDAPSDSSPAAAPVDPCALITVAEANSVAGVTTLPPQPAGNPPTRCVWATPTSGAVGQVEIDVGDGAKKTYDIDHDILKHAFTPIAGLADEAYAEDSTVFFRKGDTWVAIHVVRLDDSKLWMPKLIALAKTVAPRI